MHDKKYLNLVSSILELGNFRPPAREGMPPTIGLFGQAITFKDVDSRFPLLTTKEMDFNNIVVELLWFLRGESNIKYLVENKCNIWNDDCYKYYLRLAKKYEFEPCEKDEFIKHVLSQKKIVLLGGADNDIKEYTFGDLGKVYPHEWRSFADSIDQIAKIQTSIETEPFSRYHVVSAWNPSTHHDVALPPCHILFQFYVRFEKDAKYLDIAFYMRSVDVGLGLPYNVASYAALLLAVADKTGCIAGDVTFFGGDTHIYENHQEKLREQALRKPMASPVCVIDSPREVNLWDMKPKDFILRNYTSHPPVRLKLSVGK